MAGERRLYLERNCRLPESPAHSRRRNREGPASSKGLNSQRGFGPAVEPRRKSRPRSTSLHGSSPCKCQRLSTLRWDRLPPSRPSTKSGARAGGRRLSDRRLHRWLAGTSASAPSSHGAADLLGLNRAHICVRNLLISGSGEGEVKDRPVAEETSLVLIEITEQGFEGVCDLRRDEKQHAPARIVEVDIRVTGTASRGCGFQPCGHSAGSSYKCMQAEEG